MCASSPSILNTVCSLIVNPQPSVRHWRIDVFARIGSSLASQQGQRRRIRFCP
jgi:hypothetical protein